jgi:flagellar basal-body rod protein FlgC
MDKPMNIFDIAGRAMSAQLVRLNTTASNLANAGSISATKEGAFRSLKPVFESVNERPGIATVGVSKVVQASAEPIKRHAPGHPLADAEGYVWEAAVDSSAELIEMIESARQYQNNVQVLQTAKTLTLDTLRLGQ